MLNIYRKIVSLVSAPNELVSCLKNQLKNGVLAGWMMANLPFGISFVLKHSMKLL
jgi:hypothetical protein